MNHVVVADHFMCGGNDSETVIAYELSETTPGLGETV
jgi:hypothetical protein